MTTTLPLSPKQRANLIAAQTQAVQAKAAVEVYVTALMDGAPDGNVAYTTWKITDAGLELTEAPSGPQLVTDTPDAPTDGRDVADAATGS